MCDSQEDYNEALNEMVKRITKNTVNGEGEE